MTSRSIDQARAADWVAVWTAPVMLARTAFAYAEMLAGAQTVIAARLPLIAEALATPWGAHHAEMGLMVSEKVDAFGRSARTAHQTSERLRRAIDAQAHAVGRIGRGALPTPLDWWGMVERNVAICAALAALPGAMLEPVGRGVAANARRLAAGQA